MGSTLQTEKLKCNNYASSEYKMHHYMLGHNYLSYIFGYMRDVMMLKAAWENLKKVFATYTMVRKL